jgi:hypothetical protein
MAQEREELPPIAHDARAEVAVIDALLDRRRDLALAAARVSPPDYIVAELGDRPAGGSGAGRLGRGGAGDRGLPPTDGASGQRLRARAGADGPGGTPGARARAGGDEALADATRDRADAEDRAGSVDDGDRAVRGWL